MPIYAPMITYGVMYWGRWLSCSWLMPRLFTQFEYENKLDEITAESICNKGVSMYFENYFTKGNEELPWANTFTWAGS